MLPVFLGLGMVPKVVYLLEQVTGTVATALQTRKAIRQDAQAGGQGDMRLVPIVTSQPLTPVLENGVKRARMLRTSGGPTIEYAALTDTEIQSLGAKEVDGIGRALAVLPHLEGQS